MFKSYCRFSKLSQSELLTNVYFNIKASAVNVSGINKQHLPVHCLFTAIKWKSATSGSRSSTRPIMLSASVCSPLSCTYNLPDLICTSLLIRSCSDCKEIHDKCCCSEKWPLLSTALNHMLLPSGLMN